MKTKLLLSILTIFLISTSFAAAYCCDCNYDPQYGTVICSCEPGDCGEDPQPGDFEYSVNQPLPNSVHDDNDISFNIVASQPVDMYYSRNGENYKTLCQSCSAYSDQESISDGEYDLSVKLILNDGTTLIENIPNVLIDSDAPEIEEVLPEEDFANGHFSVEYDEDHLEYVKLFYKGTQESTYNEVELTNCPSGRRQVCETDVDLSTYDESSIDFYFKVADKVTEVESDVYTLPVDFTSPTITLNHPTDEAIYNDDKVIIDLTLSEQVEELEYSEDGGESFRRLDDDCLIYNDDKSFDEGQTDLVIKATDYAGNIQTKEVTFFIDSEIPDIDEVNPEEDFANGHFTVEYDEENLEQIKLYYKGTQETTYNQHELTNCPSGRREICETDVDLSQYDGNEIDFFFEIKDKATTVQSETITLPVDFTKPTITINSPVEDGEYADRRVLFDIVIDEEVEELEYSEDGERFRRLCRNCDSYNKEKSFKGGIQNLILRATDKAGNKKEETISFYVDSNAPKVYDAYPDDDEFDVDGTFTVKYREKEEVSSVKLFYKGTQETNYNEVEVTGCEEGSRQYCSIQIDTSPYDGDEIEYYFEVSDRVASDVSDVKNIKVDQTAPSITLNNPTDGAVYTDDDVLIDVSLNEEAYRIEYSEDGDRFRRLCSRCSEYSGEKDFDEGTNNFVLRATDYAGNQESIALNFDVIED